MRRFVAVSSMTSLLAVFFVLLSSAIAQDFAAEAASALAQASSKARPRGFPSGTSEAGLREFLLRGEGKAAWEALNADLARRANRTLPKGGGSAPGASLQSTMQREFDQLMAASLIWRLEKNDRALAEATRTALNLAGWAVSGEAGYSRSPIEARRIGLMLAVAYDWLNDGLSSEDKDTLRVAALAWFRDVASAATGALERRGALGDTTAWATIGRAAAMAALLGGEPGFDQPLGLRTLAVHLGGIGAWGVPDGGYANGGGYAIWVLGDLLIPWDIIREATGMDPYDSPWLKSMVGFFAHTVPPGAPALAFGDGAESISPRIASTVVRAFMARFRNPVSEWYRRKATDIHPHELAHVIASRATLALDSLPLPIPNAHAYLGIGIAAMHSDLNDPRRTSLYFRSSPFGSLNHNHADQNSFVIHSRGLALAIDSGYYDYYESDHWKRWYKQTLAHNAITVDGGDGQWLGKLGRGERSAAGRISAFEHHAAWDKVVGDAVAAYAGKLTKAERTLVFIRPDTIVVFDSLESAQPRTWEWNLHTASRFDLRDDGGSVRHHGVRMCLDIKAFDSMKSEQTEEFSAPPNGTKRPKQFHVRFSTSAPSRSASIAAVISVECGSPPARFERTATGWQIEVQGWQVSLSDGKSEVRRATP